MRFNPDAHRRRSIRLGGYDYSRPGAYFVTVCAHGRECRLGEIAGGEVRLNDAGEMVQRTWEELPSKYPGVEIDSFVVMPNHVHGIIVLTDPVGAGPRARPACPGLPARPVEGRPRGASPTRFSLADVVHRFKSLTTARYRSGVARLGWPPFPARLWQRNYYDRIIRGEEELAKIREYIAANPVQWAEDENHPGNVSHPQGRISYSPRGIV